MPSLDIAMPIALFLVVMVAMFLNKRVEGKLMATVEEKQFKTRDIILLVVFMAVMISVIAYTSIIAPEQVFSNVFLILFLSSYTMLLFTFSYVFSNLTKKRAQLISTGFGVASVIAGVTSLLGPVSDSLTIYRAIAFFGLAIFCFSTIIIEQKKLVSKARWYVAAQPPALFVLLFLLFNVFYGGAAQVWYPLLLDVFGFTFAILIILYLSSLFSWKTVGIFAVLLTAMDIFLVIGTGTMVQAANQFTGLGLPVLVYLPKIPLTLAPLNYLGLTFLGYLPSGLGLGDFFFAGVLAVQTFNKFGRKTALFAVVAMVVAFGIWEAFLPEIILGLIPIVGRNIQGFPGTLMIISGWAPIVALKLLNNRNKTTPAPITAPTSEAPKEPSLPIQ
jgi:hypothetical protein